jgi:hypothetical protein
MYSIVSFIQRKRRGSPMKALMALLFVLLTPLASQADASKYFDKIIYQKQLDDFKTSGRLDQMMKDLNSKLGHGEGNGGDYIRATFIKLGKQVIKYLDESPMGQSILIVTGISLDDLEASLDTKKITTVDYILLDNTESIVDAIGVEDMILLNQEAWFEHFNRERDIYFLVFHEMLRSIQVNDDDYLISQYLMNFPSKYKISTNVKPALPLIEEQVLDKVFDPATIQLAGTGCKSTQPNKVEFNFSENVLEVTPQSYFASAGKSSRKRIVRKSCVLAAPFKGIPGKRVVISMIDVAGKVSVNPGAKAKIAFEGFTAGNTGTKKSTTIENTTSEDIIGKVIVREGGIYKSDCGQGSNLRVNTSLYLKNTDRKEDAHAEVDKIKIYLALESCTP